MDYCRFENTLHAMEECLNHIEECEETSDREIKYAKRLYEACKEFIDRCNDNGIKKYEDEGEKGLVVDGVSEEIAEIEVTVTYQKYQVSDVSIN